MENSFFIFTDKTNPTEIERFHICAWEFRKSSLIEFGFEVSNDSLKLLPNNFSISLYIPWFNKKCDTKDLYEKLSIAENSRFIFNDSISETKFLDDGRNKNGVIHVFDGDRKTLCILPITKFIKDEKIVTINLDLKAYKNHISANKSNIYFRFWIKPTVPFISMRKKGISKTTVIYDVKVNEKRNAPMDSLMKDVDFCKIKSTFLLTIIPNNYDLTFFETEHLRKIRGLEYNSFKTYLNDNRIKENEHLVVVCKKDNMDSYSFFSIFTEERIGIGQFSLAILINIVCGILLFIPSYRKTFTPEIPLTQIWNHLPLEIFVAFLIILLTLIYFTWPSIVHLLKRIFNK
ncbi:MAG: hypothetical protein F9K09_02395 [Flavobacteriales bacterium]|nr:MAG: hypothetical protein F9K09_02395 [Flavobacteriales bacterium]